jgi:hypothetical protein
MEIFRYFNWVDLFISSVLIRVLYIGFKNGFVVEFFKILTTLFAIFITLHYYSGLSRFLYPHLQFLGDILDFFVFGFLWLLVIIIFKLVRDGLMLILRIEANAALEKWGGLLLAVVRGALVCSLFFLLLNCWGGEYMDRNLKGSFIRPHIGHLALDVYRWSYGAMINKLFPEEKLNIEAFQSAHIDE